MPQEYKHSSRNSKKYALLLYILPAPLILKLILSLLTLNPLKFAIAGGALFFFYSAARLTSKSLSLIDESKQRPKPQSFTDYRFVSMIYTGVGVLILMFLIKSKLIGMIMMPSVAMLGYYFCYGLREAKQKSFEDFKEMPQATREALRGAYKDIADIEQLATQLTSVNDQQVVANIKEVVNQSYTILELLSKSPNDASKARRFLNVYTNRIKEILEQYIHLNKYDKSDNYRDKLNDVLVMTYKAFSDKESKLLDGDKLQLDVQLEVFDEQIKNEHMK